MPSAFGMALLEGLTSAPWMVAVRTIGNDHATLIGLLVYWWTMSRPEARWAIEGGPSFGYHEKGTGGGMCDAIFCEEAEAVGMLEVEGIRSVYTVQKIGKFFASQLDDLQSLRFAILLLYSYQIVGRGAGRAMAPAKTPEVSRAILELSHSFPQKPIVTIALDKTYERQRPGIRRRNEYYFGTPSSIQGYLYEGGQEGASITYYRSV